MQQLPGRHLSLRTIELDHGDGDVGIYDAAGTFLEASFIEMTIPDKPRSRLQKYRLTPAGRQALELE